MVLDCPKCGLVNPPDAQRCDCGYDFASRTVQQSYLGPKEAQALNTPTVGEIVLCVLIPVVGIFLGLGARRQGRSGAGKTMLIISGAMLVAGVGLRLLIWAAQ